MMRAIAWGAGVGAGTASRLRPLGRLGDPAVGIVGILGLLEVLSRTEILPSRHFPPPSAIFSTFGSLLATSEYWSALGETLAGWGAGLAVAIAIGIPIGLAIGVSEYVYRALRPIIEFMRPIPPIALLPLVVLIYGRTVEMKMVLVVFACIWPLLFQTAYGVRDVDPVALDTGRAYRLSWMSRLLRIRLPSAIPYVATGVRIAATIALLVTVVAELVSGAGGLGAKILIAELGGAVEHMYAWILTIGLLGLGMNTALARLEHRALRWHPAHREAAS